MRESERLRERLREIEQAVSGDKHAESYRDFETAYETLYIEHEQAITALERAEARVERMKRERHKGNWEAPSGYGGRFYFAVWSNCFGRVTSIITGNVAELRTEVIGWVNDAIDDNNEWVDGHPVGVHLSHVSSLRSALRYIRWDVYEGGGVFHLHRLNYWHPEYSVCGAVGDDTADPDDEEATDGE